MSRFYLLFVLAFLMPFAAYSRNYIEEGMEWHSLRVDSTESGLVYSIEVVTLENWDGHSWYKAYVSYGEDRSVKELAGLVAVSGDNHVYYKEDISFTQILHNMYDFGLEVGDSTYISSADKDLIQTYIKCTGIEKCPYSGWDIMTFDEYKDLRYTELCGHGSWLIGLSSTQGFLKNNQFGMDGSSSRLFLVKDASGREIYSNPSVSIPETAVKTEFVRVEGRSVFVDGQGDCYCDLYEKSGKLIGRYRLDATNRCIELPGSGLYILRMENGRSLKILAL